jgi:16S rRNA (guanine1207-N2)-methyltransferase
MDSPAFNLLIEAAKQQHVQRMAVLNAQAHPWLSHFHQHSELSLYQSFKPLILDIQTMGLGVAPLQGEYDLILLVPAKDKIQSLGWMAQAFEHLTHGGKLMMACENQYGAKSYESALKKLAGHTACTSKSKCRLFSAKKTPSLNIELQQQWLENTKPSVIPSHGLWAQPGLFSWKKPDVGSQMLLNHLPVLSGKVMDLCCGYGLLAAHCLKASPSITHLHLVEADSLALDCAKKNVAEGITGDTDISPHHVDAAHESLPKHFNYVVCNPPFHTGQTRDVELGQK